MTLDRTFAELRPAMFALAYRITGNRADAEEIVQDAFVRLHDAEPKDAVRSLKAYLATITARLSFNRLRDQRAPRILHRRMVAGAVGDGGRTSRARRGCFVRPARGARAPVAG
jgi:DNA-directed RNA polymerase specialized sigma24 family protein